LQIAGTPTKGDVYNFTINGDAVSFELTADSGTNFTIGNIKLNGSAIPTTSGNAGVFETGDMTLTGLGNDKHAVAKAAAVIINGMANTASTHAATQAGLVATAASDGSVTLIQKAVITAAAFDDAGTSNAATYTESSNTIQFAAIGADGAYVAANDNLAFTINGVTFDISTQEATFNTTTGAGLVAAINAEIAAHKDSLKGITNLSAADTGNTIDITFTPAVSLTSVSATAGQTTTAVDVTSTSGIDAAIVAIDAAIKKTNNQRASLGSISNRLDNTVSNLTNISSNLQAGRGRIEDADFAAETTNLARTQILQQASTAMLAQANASKQNVLSLLQG
jgi:flagellin